MGNPHSWHMCTGGKLKKMSLSMILLQTFLLIVGLFLVPLVCIAGPGDNLK